MKNNKNNLALFAILAYAATGSLHAAYISGVSGFDPPPLPGATDIVTFDSETNATFSTLHLGNVTFTGIDGDLATDNSFAGDYNGRGTEYLQNNSGATNSIRFDFDSLVDAFAFNWGASDNQWVLSAYSSTGTLLESYDISITLTSNAGDYVGISASGISYATLTTTSSDYVFIDNFTTSSVPEPSSMALMGLGASGLLFARRRRH